MYPTFRVLGTGGLVMKILFVLLTTVMLSGCDKELNKARAKYLCQEHNGLWEAGWVDAYTNYKIKCRDGTVLTRPVAAMKDVNHPDVSKYLPPNNKEN